MGLVGGMARGLACCGLALMTGTVGTVSAAAFVRAIYSSIKGD